MGANLSVEHQKSIEEAISNYEKKLRLSGAELPIIPKKIFKASDLEELILSKNVIKSIDPGILSLSNLKKLDLSDNSIESICKELSKLPSLQNLILSNNNITHVPESIGNFPKLRRLLLDNNDIKSVDKAIVKCQTLRHLDLSFNKFNGNIPAEIKDMKELTKVFFSGNELQFLPHTVMEMKQLTHLGLENNEISHLDGIGQLPELEYLSVTSNRIRTLPPEMGKLEELKELRLGQNGIFDLPKEMENLQELEVLTLGDNAISSLPKWISKWRLLKHFDLTRNKLETLPAELGYMKELNTLLLAGNSIKELPFELGLCEKIDEINLQGNVEIETPPAGVRKEGEATMLRWLRNRIRASHYTTTAEGEGLEHAIAGEEANFTIVARNLVGQSMDRAGDTFRAKLTRVAEADDDPEFSMDAYVNAIKDVDTEKGIYHARYLTNVAGEYLISITCGVEHIQGSPFRSQVFPTEAVASNCVAMGIGHTATVGTKTVFKLVAKDTYGNTLTSTPDRDFFVSIVGKSGVVDCLIKNNKDGTFGVSWTPPVAGPFVILVKLQDAQIGGSPYKILAKMPEDVM